MGRSSPVRRGPEGPQTPVHWRACLRPGLFVMALAACGAPSEPKVPPLVPSANATTTPQTPIGAPAARRDPLVGPHGETAVLMGHRVKLISRPGSEQVIEPTELHPPPGDRSLLGISPTAYMFLDDGTLLVGMGDGTVTALDSAGRRRYSLGFRGAIRGLVPAGDGLVAVTTQRGVMALMTHEGRLRWERQITAERLSPAILAGGQTIVAASQRGVFAFSQRGELVFSHASRLLHHDCEREEKDCKDQGVPDLTLSGDEIVAGPHLRFRLDSPHPAVPSLEPTFPLTFRKVLDGSVVSLLVTGPKELLALTTHRSFRSDYEWGADDKFEVVRIEGSRMTRVAVPHIASRSEVFVDGTTAEQASLFIDALVHGPNGSTWILARRYNSQKTQTGDGMMTQFGGAGQILELRGGVIRERNDLFKVFAAHYLSEKIAAAPVGPAKLFCFGLEKPTCVTHDGSSFSELVAPGRVASVVPLGDSAWLLSDEGRIYVRERDGFVTVIQPDDTRLQGLVGTSEKDVWADFKQRYTLLHFNGTEWAEVPVPTPVHDFQTNWSFHRARWPSVAVPAGVHGFFARAPDDVWMGRIHWDGSRWSLVHGVPTATTALARARDDVWLGDAGGLWHGTAPGPVPVRLRPPQKPDEGAIPAPIPLPLDTPEAHHVVERMNLTVAGAAPLTAARSVSAAPDGVLWIQTWDRMVEVDGGGRATTLRGKGRESFGRWAYPEARGRGTILMDDEVRRINGRATTREEMQLDHHDAMAVHGDGRGSTWVVGTSPLLTEDTFSYKDLRTMGASTWEELWPHALVRAPGAGFRPVLGLPSASWCDVAATPDGGAWFAGGLSQGPAGEGILFHARGPLGGEATARYRAPASLLAVTAMGPDEAWAVGAAGTVVHVKGGAVTRYRLPSGEWLRAVSGSGPDDVWIGGDGGTLIHYDGRAFHPMQHPLGARAAFTGIASSRGMLWAVGPSGIVRITKRP